MPPRFPTWQGHLLAVIVSPLAAFFAVFNVLFSDVFGLGQRLQAIVYVFVVYLIVGWVFGRLWPMRRRSWALWLIVPGGLFGLPFTVADHGWTVYGVSVIAAMILASLLGTGLLTVKSAGSPRQHSSRPP
ncbi:MAG: hypothetical protein HYY50_03385 [Candidatus Kerfeldbacteria bacterium]|nr:hypothetical protein [Candidatus Kerfeldbacteria bacterium]